MAHWLKLASVLVAGVALTAPALGADYPDMRTSYPVAWGNDSASTADPVGFEFGLRYNYSMASHNLSIGGDHYSYSNTSHFLEGYGRIDDFSTNTYLKGNVGYAAIIDGTYSTPSATNASIIGGHIGYADLDFGYMPWGGDLLRFGPFVGYNYMNESPDMGGSNNEMQIHNLRLGVTARSQIGESVDINAEAALVPYSYLSGNYAAYNGNAGGAIEGNLYGAQGQVMLDYKPYGGLVVGVGARASYLTGNASVNGTKADSIDFVRYGLLGELGASF